MRTPLLGLVGLLVISFPISAQSSSDATEGRAFKPQDWYRLTRVSSPAMSPSGDYVAFTVTTVAEEENRLHSEVWMVSTQEGEPVRLTAPGTESSNPRWSEDGAYLLFTSRRDGGEGSTWALHMDRSPSGEAFQLEDWPTGSTPTDGSFAVWTESPEDEDVTEEEGESAEEASVDPFEEMPSTARPPWGSVTEPLDPSRFDGRHIVELPYKRNGTGFVANPSEAEEWNPTQIWKQSFGDSEKEMLTDAPYSHRNATVSPDGRWIAFVADGQLRNDAVVQAERDSLALLPYDAERDEAPRNDADIFLIPIDGGEPTRVTTPTNIPV